MYMYFDVWSAIINMLVDLILNVPVNSFSVMMGRSQRFLGITSTFGECMCLAEGHNTAGVGMEPPTSRSRVWRANH